MSVPRPRQSGPGGPVLPSADDRAGGRGDDARLLGPSGSREPARPLEPAGPAGPAGAGLASAGAHRRSGAEVGTPSPEEPVPDALVEQAIQVIDTRAVRTVFQPLVHLVSGETVGFEAFTRGPSGSAVESPLALLRGARAGGRLTELDWLCAASACAAARSFHLHASTSVFLNFEPATLLTPCPEDLARMTRWAQDQLRVFVEVKEGMLVDAPRATFDALTQVRAIGWGIAVDNAEATAASLVLFPLADPDVLKIDLRGVRGDSAAIAAMSDGARLYAEQSGASILAEGIEDADDVQIARAAGAEFGQGWHLGRPEPLQGAPVSPHSVFPILQRSPSDAAGTSFHTAGQQVGTSIAEGRILQPIATYLVEQSIGHGPPALLMVSFDERSRPSADDIERLAEVVDHAAFVVVAGPEVGSGPPARRILHLEHRRAMGADWSVIVLGPHYAGALLARDVGDTGPNDSRRFEYLVTHNRDLVLRMARSVLSQTSTVPA